MQISISKQISKNKSAAIKFTVLFLFILTVLTLSQNAATDTIPQITEDSPNVSTGDYIVPNENHPDFFYAVNREMTGALISVGTFRALAAASMGDFSHVIMLDIDQLVCDFNRRQIKVLSESESAGDFLARLAGAKEQRELFENALAGDTEAITKTKLLLSEIFSHSTYYEGNRAADRLWDYLVKVIDISKQDPGVTFLRNTQAFQKISRLARKNKIIILAGDLAGKKTVKELSQHLKKEGIAVGILDISNALDYILREPGFHNFIKNLKLLPFLPQGRINFTIQSYDILGKKYFNSSWLYISINFKEYIQKSKIFLPSNFEFAKFYLNRIILTWAYNSLTKRLREFVRGLIGTPAFLNKVQSCEELLSFR